MKEHFKNSKFPCEADEYMPVIFTPPRDGKLLSEPNPIVGRGINSSLLLSSSSAVASEEEEDDDNDILENGYNIINTSNDEAPRNGGSDENYDVASNHDSSTFSTSVCMLASSAN